MHIWVDADACPAVAREILFRASVRTGCSMTLVANRTLRTPDSCSWIRSIRVADGHNVADDYIAESLAAGDLVITADVPLAAQVVEACSDTPTDLENRNQLLVRMTTQNLDEAIRARKNGRAPVYED